MNNDNLERRIRAIMDNARPTPEAEAAMDEAFAAIAQEAAARSAAPSTSRHRLAPVLVPRWAPGGRRGLRRVPGRGRHRLRPPTSWGSSACSSPATTRL